MSQRLNEIFDYFLDDNIPSILSSDKFFVFEDIGNLGYK